MACLEAFAGLRKAGKRAAGGLRSDSEHSETSRLAVATAERPSEDGSELAASVSRGGWGRHNISGISSAGSLRSGGMLRKEQQKETGGRDEENEQCAV